MVRGLSAERCKGGFWLNQKDPTLQLTYLTLLMATTSTNSGRTLTNEGAPKDYNPAGG